MSEGIDSTAEEALRLRTERASDEEYALLFRVIATWELSTFVPAKRQRKSALKSLACAFGSRDAARRAAEILLESEQSAECPAEAEDDCDCIARLRRLAVELGRTPLRVEVSETDMLLLLRKYGGFRNALALAGLRTLSGETLERARRDYMLANASPELLNEDIKDKLTDADMRELQGICDKARSLGRAPVRGDIPEKLFNHINKRCGSWRAVMVHMGLTPLDKKTDRKLSRRTLKKRANKKKRQTAKRNASH
jgi:hypothetical protein